MFPPEGKTVISQGKKIVRDSLVYFKPEYPLLGISLCIGDYVNRKVTVDSVDFEFNVFGKHGALLKKLEESGNPFQHYIVEGREQIEESMGMKYPYKRFAMVEIPRTFKAYNHLLCGKSEFVHPEQVFLPESFVVSCGKRLIQEKELARAVKIIAMNVNYYLSNKYNKRYYQNYYSPGILFGIDVSGDWEKNQVFTRNPYAVWPLFCQQVLAIESFDCPLWSMILPFLNRKFFTPGNGEIDYLEERAVACLKNHSLKEIVNEGKMCDNLLFKIFVIKAKMLQAMIYAHGIHPDSLDDFISSFIDEYKFQQVSFTLFATLFQQRFGVDIRDEWVRWYEDSGIPFYVFQDCCYRKVMEGEAERENSLLQLEFTVLNEGNRDGIVTVEWTKKHIKGKDFPFRKDYRVKAGQAKRIACVISASDYRINLNLAGNVPRRMSFMSGPIIPFLVDTVQLIMRMKVFKYISLH